MSVLPAKSKCHLIRNKYRLQLPLSWYTTLLCSFQYIQYYVQKFNMQRGISPVPTLAYIGAVFVAELTIGETPWPFNGDGCLPEFPAETAHFFCAAWALCAALLVANLVGRVARLADSIAPLLISETLPRRYRWRSWLLRFTSAPIHARTGRLFVY